MRVDVVALNAHTGAVPHDAFDHGGHLGGGAGDQLRMDRHRARLDAPIHQHAAAAVAGVPFGEDVAVIGGEVGGVGGHGGRALTPDGLLTCGEGGVGDGCGGGFQPRGGEVAAGDV